MHADMTAITILTKLFEWRGRQLSTTRAILWKIKTNEPFGQPNNKMKNKIEADTTDAIEIKKIIRHYYD